MFFLLSKILDFVVSPLMWILILLLSGLFVRKPLLKKRFLISAIVLLIVFTNPFLLLKTEEIWELPSVSYDEIKTPYDIGIVMGGSMRFYDARAGRVVYSNSVDRLIQALELYHRQKIKKILLTGGSGFVNFQEWKESGLIADVLLKSGVNSEDIILENNSRNTYENALQTAHILQHENYGKRYLLITSAFHMRRSLACFNHQGIHPDIFPVDVRAASGVLTLDRLIEPNADNLSSWDVLIHEWVGMLMYKIMDYI